MIRGTTPTNVFTTEDVDLSDATVYVTYSQGGNVLFEKTGDDVVVNVVDDEQEEPVYTVQTELTQEETLMFNPTLQVRIQIRAIFANNKAIASQIMEVSVEDVLKDGVIEYEP